MREAKAAAERPAPASMLAIQIVKTAMKADVTVNELIAICQNDSGFVLRLLSRINGASFGLKRRVASVAQAVALLGVRGLRNLALTTCVVDMTPRGDEGNILLGLCLRRGVAARLVAEAAGIANAGDFFTLGVLLKIGLLVRARDDLAGAASVAQAPAAARATLERAEGREDHARTGAQLAESWELDTDLCNAIAVHQAREPPQAVSGAIGWFAERLASMFEGGDPALLRAEIVAARGRFQLSENAIDDLLRRIPDAVQELATEMNREIGPQAPLDAVLREANAYLIDLNRNYAEVVQRLEKMLAEKDQLAGQLVEANGKLTSLALHDSVTGLFNHRAFGEALERDLARTDRSATTLSLILLDLDHFKSVNDTRGHQMGDKVLHGLAEVLRASTRVSDVAARVGGDEFALILPGTPRAGGLVVAERIRKMLDKHAFTSGAATFRVTVSLGIASAHGPGCHARGQELIAAADKALYAAKRGGRDRIELAEEHLSSETRSSSGAGL